MDNQLLLEILEQKFGKDLINAQEPHGLLTIHVSKDDILDVLRFLKDEQDFSYLTDITAVHYPNLELSFAIVYHLHNLVKNHRIRLKVFVGGEVPSVPSATAIWNGANWMERETYDFFGIQFDGHPDLRRILNMDELDVFPMRKEYPLEDPNKVDKKDFYFGR